MRKHSIVTYLDAMVFGKFLVIFVKKYFLPMFKDFWAKKSNFSYFSKMHF